MAYQTGKTKEVLLHNKKQNTPNTIKEREILKKYVVPLSASQEYDLSCDNDAAVIEFPAGRQIVVTSDVIIEGVHFLSTDPPELIAKKAIRVNLSDLAAMGAHPIGYTLCLTLDNKFDEAWMTKFVEGLSADHVAHHISLIGGDITKYDGPLHISVTAIGDVAEGQALSRSTAQPGDRIYVTGTIGDASLGLKILQGEFDDLKQEYKEYLINRYHLPNPRHILGQSLIQVAHSATDISDGLISDLGLISEASKLSAYLKLDQIPLSKAARNVLTKMRKSPLEFYETIMSGGDDYELIFTASPGEAEHIDYLSKRYKVPITCVGHFGALPELDYDLREKESLVKLLDTNGQTVTFNIEGYQHEWEKV